MRIDLDPAVARIRRGQHAAVSGVRAGRMLGVSAKRLPGAGSSFALLAVTLIMALTILGVRRAFA